jgi:hypothetical protein
MEVQSNPIGTTISIILPSRPSSPSTHHLSLASKRQRGFIRSKNAHPAQDEKAEDVRFCTT